MFRQIAFAVSLVVLATAPAVAGTDDPHFHTVGSTEAPEVVNPNENQLFWLLKPAGIPPLMTPDIVGAFRFTCRHSDFFKEDPIVYPGQANVGHWHEGFGNREINKDSTFESLRTSMETPSCIGGPLNMTGYWQAAMLDMMGNLIKSESITIYYKGAPRTDANGDGVPGDENGTPQTTTFPDRLKLVFGGSPAEPIGKGTWQCLVRDRRPGSTNLNVRSVGKAGAKNLAEALTPECLNHPGSEIDPARPSYDPFLTEKSVSVQVALPPCWNGELDSPDHRSHVTGKISNATTNWKSVCPSTHPYELAHLLINPSWRVWGTEDVSKWRLASDVAGYPAGHSAHMDWFGAWSRKIRDDFHKFCIGGFRSGQSFNLCNGTQGRQPDWFTFWEPRETQKVSIASIENGTYRKPKYGPVAPFTVEALAPTSVPEGVVAKFMVRTPTPLAAGVGVNLTIHIGQHTAKTANLYFPPGRTEAAYNIPTTRDGFYGSALNGPVGIALESGSNAFVSVLDSDPAPAYSVAAVAAQVEEGQPAVFNITAAFSSPVDTTVNVTVNDTPDTVTIKANDTMAVLSIPTLRDGTYGTVPSPVVVKLPNGQTATVTLTEADPAFDYETREAGTGWGVFRLGVEWLRDLSKATADAVCQEFVQFGKSCHLGE